MREKGCIFPYKAFSKDLTTLGLISPWVKLVTWSHFCHKQKEEMPSLSWISVSPVGKMGSSFSTASLLTVVWQTDRREARGRQGTLGRGARNSQEETRGWLGLRGVPEEMGRSGYGDGGG